MYDIITFGAASEDIYLVSKNFVAFKSKVFTKGKGICLNLASKTEIDDVFFSSGGGGTNTAATFANLGFRTAFCGMIGQDYFGNLIIEELKALGVSTDFIKRTTVKPTNVSVIFSYPGADKTLLVYRGASDILQKKDIPWSKIKSARWFYLAPFSGQLADLTEEIIDFAKKNKIKTAMNPGYNQLSFQKPTLERILKKVDILILNQAEASLVAKIPFQKEKLIMKKICQLTPGICIMTKGEQGAKVADGKYVYQAKTLKMKNIDSTGAGDSFGSGFVSGFIRKGSIPYAIQLAMANSGLNISKLGAKQGLLKKNQAFVKVKVKNSEF